jgi:hypothetical protein
LLHISSGLWHTHALFEHAEPAAHTLPHAPQLALSVTVSVHPLEQLVSGALQETAPPVPPVVELAVLALALPPPPLDEVNAAPRQPTAGSVASAATSQPNQKPSFIGTSSASPPAPRGDTPRFILHGRRRQYALQAPVNAGLVFATKALMPAR